MSDYKKTLLTILVNVAASVSETRNISISSFLLFVCVRETSGPCPFLMSTRLVRLPFFVEQQRTKTEHQESWLKGSIKIRRSTTRKVRVSLSPPFTSRCRISSKSYLSSSTRRNSVKSTNANLFTGRNIDSFIRCWYSSFQCLSNITITLEPLSVLFQKAWKEHISLNPDFVCSLVSKERRFVVSDSICQRQKLGKIS